MSNKPVVTRFAPSPTGYLHIGGARSALFNYLFTRSVGGKFILRIEDTDTLRNQPEYETDIIESPNWLGIKYDEMYRQSDRTAIYKEQLERLISEDKAYVSQEKIEKEGDRAEVIRFRNPGKVVVFEDLIRGKVEMDTADLGDFVIAKDLESPVFHFTNVVDDWTMGITHAIRGEEHLSNTPRQILILEALGAPIPTYAHISLILDDSRAKLSKRKHGEFVWIKTYREQGYLPEALINYFALLGWSPQAKTATNPGTDQEVFSLEELIKLFSLEGVQKSGAIFDMEKLKWFNREHLKRKDPLDLLGLASSFISSEMRSLPQFSEERLAKVIPAIMERLTTLNEITDLEKNREIQYFFAAPEYDKSLLKTTVHLPEVIKLLENIDENVFNAENIKNAVWNYATEKGRGEVLWPMRVALTGRDKSPDPFTVGSILGKAETLARLASALS